MRSKPYIIVSAVLLVDALAILAFTVSRIPQAPLKLATSSGAELVEVRF